MPFKSEAQRRWMYSQKPEMAKRWQAHTPKGKKLPKHVKKAELDVLADLPLEFQVKVAALLLRKLAADERCPPESRDSFLKTAAVAESGKMEKEAIIGLLANVASRALAAGGKHILPAIGRAVQWGSNLVGGSSNPLGITGALTRGARTMNQTARGLYNNHYLPRMTAANPGLVRGAIQPAANAKLPTYNQMSASPTGGWATGAYNMGASMLPFMLMQPAMDFAFGGQQQQPQPQQPY